MLSTPKFFAVLVALLVLHSFCSLGQEVVSLQDVEKTYSIGLQTAFWKDTTGDAYFTEMLAAEEKGEFTPSERELLFFGIDQAAYWVKIQLQRRNMKEENWMLLFDFPILDSVDVYQLVDNQETTKLTMGFCVPQSQKPVDFNAFAIPLKLTDYRVHTFYVRIKSRKSKVLPISVMSEKSFQHLRGMRDVGYGVFVGILLIMTIYNFIIYLSLRDRSYLYYTMATAVIMGTYMSSSGYSSYYLWPEQSWLNQYLLIWLSCLVSISMGLFTQSFLSIKRYSKLLHRALNILMGISALGIVGAVLSTFIVGYAMYYVLFLQVLAMLAAGVIAHRSGEAEAKYYNIALSGFLLGAIMTMLRNLGVLPSTDVVNHAGEIGAVWQIIMLAQALSARYGRIDRESKVAIRAKLEAEAKAKKNLEAKVTERTAELQEANEELNMMVEEVNATNERLSDSLTEVSKKNSNIMASITYAKRIQQALLPEEGALAKGFPDHFVLFRPRDIVSGDFYWFDVVNDKAIILVADCTGHGVPGAFMSLLGNDAVSSAIVRAGLTSPDEILTYIDAEIYTKLQQDKSNNQDGMDVAVLVHDLNTGKIEFAGAKRPLLMANSQGLQRYKGDRFSVAGKLPKNQKHFSKQVITIEEPTTFYLFSDGYADQFGGEHNRKLTNKRLYSTIESCHDKEIAIQKEIFSKEFDLWKGHYRQIDDVLVVGLRLAPKNDQEKMA